MNIVFVTNLDDARSDVWNLNDLVKYDVPRVGERVRINFKRNDTKYFYELEVHGIVYDYEENKVTVELHIPSYYSTMTLKEYGEWFRRHRFGL